MAPSHSRTAARLRWSKQGIRAIRNGLTYILLITIGLWMATPFVWMLSTSLKTQKAIYAYPPVWIPIPPCWQTYVDLVQSFPFVHWTFNSTYIAILATVGTVVSCSTGAYAFSRFDFPGRDVLFTLLLATMMVPGFVTLIPRFVVVFKLGLMDRHLALWGPAWFGGAFGVFMLRQYFLTLPLELEDAARIDGCSSLGILWRIILPLSKPPLATLSLFSFMGHWNDLIGPLMYLSSREKMTLPFGVVLVAGPPGATIPYHIVMAGAVIMVVPIIALLVSAQKYYVQGIVTSGLKG